MSASSFYQIPFIRYFLVYISTNFSNIYLFLFLDDYLAVWTMSA